MLDLEIHYYPRYSILVGLKLVDLSVGIGFLKYSATKDKLPSLNGLLSTSIPSSSIAAANVQVYCG